jgi:prepilin-type N-terminal cleavage/methylation domain-containing protein
VDIKRNKAFTLIELIIVVCMISILIMATTIYLSWFGEKRKVIEWQWCASSIWWEINNFVFYAITSKNLKPSGSDPIFPDYYIIEFTWWDSDYCTGGHMCDKINLSFSTWDSPTNNITIYKTISVSNTCQNNKQPLKFYRSWLDTTSFIIMNKWFSPKSISDKNVFYLGNWTDVHLLWDIIIWLCINNECSTPKEIWKFIADARTQTVTLKNCKFYDNDPNKCREREN